MVSPPINIAVSYRHEWNDGFGARGWKLDYGLDDPCVIAATAETGACIATSVLVHDILDHYLCGLPLSGHRNEAIALVQLAERTGSSPTPDFARMVDEDLLHGRVNGEPLREFLPEQLRAMVPAHEEDGRRLIALLRQTLGPEMLREQLVARFHELGEAGAPSARQQWRKLGLDYLRRSAMGMALQAIIGQADRERLERSEAWACGYFLVGNHSCALQLTAPRPRCYRAPVAPR